MGTFKPELARFLALVGLWYGGNSCAVAIPQPIPLQPTSPTSSFDAVLGMSLGTSFAPEDPATSFVFEPTLRYNFNRLQYVQLASQIVRPTDAYKNFAVNKTVALFRQGFDFLPGYNPGLLFSINAVQLDRWKADGYMIRNSVGLESWREMLPGFTVLLRVTPFGQLSEYSQMANGKDMTRFGLAERSGIYLRLEPPDV